MSHEVLAAVWSALTNLQDLGAALRDAVGNSTLRLIKANHQPDETCRQFLEYAVELCILFDAIRFLSKANSKNTRRLQEHLVLVVSHLLNGLSADFESGQNALRDAAHKRIVGHTLCSAVCTLRTCAWDCHQDLRIVISKQASKLLNHAPVKDESLWLVQTLTHWILSHYSSATPLGQGADQSQMRWKMLWEANPTDRQNMIREMVKRATDTNVAAAERILPMLDLCQIYWDSDAVLIEACAEVKRPQHLERVFYVPDEIAAIRLALDVRISIQEEFAFRSMKASSSPDKLQTQSYVMFRPGVELECCQDTCVCRFDKRFSQYITSVRSKQSTLLRGAIASAFQESDVLGLPHDFFDNAYAVYTKRLKAWTDVESVNSTSEDEPSGRDSTTDTQSEDEYAEQESPESERSPPRPRLVASHSVDEANRLRSDATLEMKSMSQPDIPRRHIRPTGPLQRRTDSRSNLSETRHAQRQDSIVSALDPSEYLSELECPSPKESVNPQQLQVPDFGRADSVTTASTASGARTHRSSSQQPRPATVYSERMLESFPEAVMMEKMRPINGPDDYERSYPEVAEDPITAIQEDNASLFSDGGSMPITTRSGGHAQTQKKWPGFLKGSKKKGQFAMPHARFFTSGKHVIAWTRYGGACLDVNNPSNTRTQSINVGEIVLGAGGTRRYAVIARCDEAYNLSVYNMSELEAGLNVNLGACPKAMDVSKNDQYLAIKYPQGVRIFDLDRATKIDHKLPKIDSAKAVPGGHLVTFAHDSQSFMASTRMGPEKVLTYWSRCMDRSKHVVAQSNAPCGNIDDHGLTSLLVAGAAVRGLPTGFLSTFTEKGSPVILSMNPLQPHAIPLRDARSAIGTRLHSAAMHVDPHTHRTNMIMINQNNDIFFVSDAFGRGQEIQKIKSLKRPKSMKPEVLVGMTTADEANLFWIDAKTESGVLIKVGKSGGVTKPILIPLNIEPMCSG